jgi:hypothetical protein
MSEIVSHRRCTQCDKAMNVGDLQRFYFGKEECLDKIKCKKRVEGVKAFRRALLSRQEASD